MGKRRVASKKIQEKDSPSVKKRSRKGGTNTKTSQPVYRPGSTPANRNDRTRHYFEKDY